MKIHIVQKGDTLWKIAQKYGVDFQTLKSVNTHLSNPDLIMPGMKIKVPTGSVPVHKKEMPMPPAPSLSGGSFKEMPKPTPSMGMPMKEMPMPTPSLGMPMKEMPMPAPSQTLPMKEMPVAPMTPIPSVPVKEMPITPIKEAPIAPVKEMPMTPIQPQPQMPPQVEAPDFDLHVQQKMYNYTFNIPSYPTVPFMPKPEAAPIKIKEVPKEVPSAPIEVPKIQVPEIEKELPEMEDVPTMPAQPMPMMQAPIMHPQYCVPITGLLPGSGLPCGYPQQPFFFHGFPQIPGMPYGYGTPQGFVPVGIENDMMGVQGMQDMGELDEDGQFAMPAGMPIQPGFMMPQMGYPYLGNCFPVTGMMPGSGLPYGQMPVATPYLWNPMPQAGFPYGPGMQQGAMPTAVSPESMDENDLAQVQGYPGISPMAAPVGQMSASGGDCGCGGPTQAPTYAPQPQQPFMGAPAGYGGMPGYGAVPAGFAGMPGYGAPPMGAGMMPPNFDPNSYAMPTNAPTSPSMNPFRDEDDFEEDDSDW